MRSATRPVTPLGGRTIGGRILDVRAALDDAAAIAGAGTITGTDRDWVSVISACRAIGDQEKRFLSFYIRAAFHDSLASNVDCTGGACTGGGAPGVLAYTGASAAAAGVVCGETHSHCTKSCPRRWGTRAESARRELHAACMAVRLWAGPEFDLAPPVHAMQAGLMDLCC